MARLEPRVVAAYATGLDTADKRIETCCRFLALMLAELFVYHPNHMSTAPSEFEQRPCHSKPAVVLHAANERVHSRLRGGDRSRVLILH